MLKDLIYIPIIAMVLVIVSYYWNLKIHHRKFIGFQRWILVFMGFLFNVWGLDVIQREFMVDNGFEMLKVCTGSWLVFVIATNVKYATVYGWSKRDFWLNYGGDLVNFIVAGLLIFLVT